MRCQFVTRVASIAMLFAARGERDRRQPVDARHAVAAHDSGKPELIAVDTKGRTAGRVSLTAAAVEDWEAMSSGSCDGGHCLYVGDIGDNDAARSHVTIYRLREPSRVSGTAKIDGVFRASYPDGVAGRISPS